MVAEMVAPVWFRRKPASATRPARDHQSAGGPIQGSTWSCINLKSNQATWSYWFGWPDGNGPPDDRIAAILHEESEPSTGCERCADGRQWGQG